MTGENAARSNGRGGKATAQRSRSSRTSKTEAAKVDEVEVDQAVDTQSDSPTLTSGEVMSTEEKIVPVTAKPAKADDKQKQTAIELHQPLTMVWNRPVMPSDIEIAETISEAGVRPIAVSHLVLAGSFLNGRPIEASALTVHEMLPGDRPIFDSEFKMVEGALLPGNRPIMASSPELLAGSNLLPGNRPIANNDIVDPSAEILMGYLD